MKRSAPAPFVLLKLHALTEEQRDAILCVVGRQYLVGWEAARKAADEDDDWLDNLAVIEEAVRVDRSRLSKDTDELLTVAKLPPHDFYVDSLVNNLHMDTFFREGRTAGITVKFGKSDFNLTTVTYSDEKLMRRVQRASKPHGRLEVTGTGKFQQKLWVST